MRVGSLILLMIVCLMALPIQAQESDSNGQWFYAWNAETGEVLAYQTSGESNLLLTADDIYPSGWRLDAETLLVIMTVDFEPGLYTLTPDAATLITPAGNAAIALENIVDHIVQTDDYVILSATSGVWGTGYVVNRRAGTVEALSGQAYAFNMGDTIRLHDDHLRYLSNNAESQWAILERDLSSDTETTLLSFESDFPVIMPDDTGRYWLNIIYDPVSRQNITQLMDADTGAITVLHEQVVDESFQNIQSYRFFEGNLLSYTAPCLTTCTLTLQTIAGEALQTFSIATLPSPNVTPLQRLDDNRVLALVENQFWILDATQPALHVGTYHVERLRNAPADLLSPDGALLLAIAPGGDPLDAPLQLIDLAAERIILQDQLPAFTVMADYTAAGLLLRHGETSNNAYFYPYGADQIMEMPLIEDAQGFFFAASEASTLLYLQTRDGDREAGIYAYDPVADRYTLLLEDAFPLMGE